MKFRCQLLAELVCLTLPAVTSLGQSKKTEPIPDKPFWQEYHEAYSLSTPEENDVRSIAFDQSGHLWAATAVGVRILNNGKWITPVGGSELGATYTVCRDGNRMLIGSWNGLYIGTMNGVLPSGVVNQPISAVTSSILRGKSTAICAGPNGIYQESGGNWNALKGSWNRGVRSLKMDSAGRIWIGTMSGLYIRESDGKTRRLSRPSVVLSSNINSVTARQDGIIYISSKGGIDLYNRLDRIASISAENGLPARDARKTVQDGTGRLWVATNLGVVRIDRKEFSLWHSRRWLQSDDARDIAIGKDGTAWVATAGGVSAIYRKKMTLSEKADYFLKMVRARHIRPPGLVGPAVLEKQGDLSKSFVEDDDNDGEHTGMYCALESMRYAVTHDPEAQKNARDAFHALMVLQQATGTRHFIARSVLPVGTAPRHEVERKFTPQEIADSFVTEPREKIIEKRWMPSPDGKWLWKRDASSDEVDGHLFGYLNYFDLAATPDEKRLVADQVDRIVGGIVDHGFKLQDIDGKGTRWANWAPESLNNDPQWFEERNGNSAEILSHLGVAYHMTKKQKYLDAARTLIAKHGYIRNMLNTRFITPSERTHINDELLSMVYPNLMQHPIVPELTAVGRQTIKQWHETCAKDRIPFYDFVYNRFSGAKVDLTGAINVLKEWPLDLIEWTVDNSKRQDVQFDKTPGLEPLFLTRTLPRYEMGICMWDQEPYKAIIGNDGAREDKPCDWLLAYWMGRYYGILGGPRR